MNCPVDAEVLVMADRQGVEIDYCPRCRGVWLDRGELDKVIERAAGGTRFDRDDDDDDYRPPTRSETYRHDDDDHRWRGPRKRKKESFLTDLFDFG